MKARIPTLAEIVHRPPVGRDVTEEIIARRAALESKKKTTHIKAIEGK